MFYPFNWFQKPQLLARMRASVLEWVQNQDLPCWVVGDGTTTKLLAERRLTVSQVAELTNLIDAAWNGVGWGGFVAGDSLADIKGFCHFKLDETKSQAELVALLISPAVSELEPLQSPVLHLALTGLLAEMPNLHSIFLPFFRADEEFSLLDRTTLAVYDCQPDDEPGWWRIVRKSGQTIDLIREAQIKLVESWLELSIRVESDMAAIASRWLAHYGYRQRLLSERPLKTDASGQQAIDETVPFMLHTYIPNDNQAEAITKRLHTFFDNLGKLRHIEGEGLQVVSLTAEQYRNIWEDYHLYRIGRRLVVKTQPQPYVPKPDELVVELIPANWVFGLQVYGLHPTTKIALEIMEDYLEPREHAKVLDLGTGSGVLAILAAKMGVEYVLALDAHAPAVEAARQNVAYNEVSSQVTVENGSLAVVQYASPDIYTFDDLAQEPPPILATVKPFDAIIANLLAHVLINLATALAEAIRPEGLLIAGGIVADKVIEVKAALAAVGFELVGTRQDGTWVVGAFKLLKIV